MKGPCILHSSGVGLAAEAICVCTCVPVWCLCVHVSQVCAPSTMQPTCCIGFYLQSTRDHTSHTPHALPTAVSVPTPSPTPKFTDGARVFQKVGEIQKSGLKPVCLGPGAGAFTIVAFCILATKAVEMLLGSAVGPENA